MRRLYGLAERQAGFFTAKQAETAGFSASSHTYHVQAGNWAREYRGIYRLTGFPAVLRPELARWHLWSMDRAGRAQGVYSHHTALALYLMPTVNPPAMGVLEMTVPRNFRRSGAIPEGLRLHYGSLPESDVSLGNGHRLTTALRTVIDLGRSGTLERTALSEALMQLVDRRLITRAQVRRAVIPEESRVQLEELLELGRR
jgi:hypothetical protein